MTKYFIRSAQVNDLESVQTIVARQNTLDYGATMPTLDDLRKKWQGMDLLEDTCVAFQENELAGYAELLEDSEIYIYLANRTNTKLAFQLLTILESRAASRTRESVSLFTRISEKNQTLLQLFALNGYRSNLSFLIMETTLNEPPPAPQWPAGITVRRFVQGQDEQATYSADEEAAEDKGYHTPLSYTDWVKRMGMDQDYFDPGLWFLACEGEEVVGVALNLLDRASNIGWVDHLSVRRAWRNRGLGKGLLLHSFAEFFWRNIHQVKLSVDSKSLTNAPHLYESVGMQTIQQYHIYRKEIQDNAQ
jgi:mycothiol synthase